MDTPPPPLSFLVLHEQITKAQKTIRNDIRDNDEDHYNESVETLHTFLTTRGCWMVFVLLYKKKTKTIVVSVLC